MEIIKANVQMFELVKEITQTTIDEIYPYYYPQGGC